MDRISLYKSKAPQQSLHRQALARIQEERLDGLDIEKKREKNGPNYDDKVALLLAAHLQERKE